MSSIVIIGSSFGLLESSINLHANWYTCYDEKRFDGSTTIILFMAWLNYCEYRDDIGL